MKQSNKWLMGEIVLHVPTLTSEGRDTIVAWLRVTADKIEAKKCDEGYSWSQPDRKYKLKVGR